MSDAPASSPRLERGLDMLPVLAALALHAVAHGRWLLCAPAAALMGALVLLRRQPTYSPLLLLLSGAIGGVVGFVMAGMWPSIAPIPATVMGPLCGALVGLSTICAICGRQTYALIYALLLSSLSVAVRGSEGLYVAMAGVGLSLLVIAFRRGNLGRAGMAGALGFGVFALVVMGVSFGLWSTVRSAEGVLTNAVFRLFQDAPRPSGMALQSEIALEIQGRMPDTRRTLMELRGDRPKRLRTVVYDTFDGARWKTSRALEQARLSLPPPRPEESLRVTELTLLQTLSPYLPAPAGTRAVEGAAPQIFGGWMLRAQGKEGSVITLRHEKKEQLPPEPSPGPALTEMPEALRAELRPLALELTRGATTPRAQAQALELWFRENYEYSLSVDLRGEGSPLAILIRERRPAWCTYFASAMAALLRSLDVPARLAGGFVPLEENSFSGDLVVRERDAHAWVEVYLEDEGRFVPFDPTPWRSREVVLPPEPPSAVGAAWRAAVSWIRRTTSRIVDSPMAVLTELASSPFTWVLVAAAVAWRMVRRYRSARADKPRDALKGANPRLTAAYALYLRTMKRGAGLVPGPTETDEELLIRLRTTRGEGAATLAEQFLSQYRRARYGGGAVDPAALGVLTRELERALRQPR
jgi:transglutaminase-like putative cysteine protease